MKMNKSKIFYIAPLFVFMLLSIGLGMAVLKGKDNISTITPLTMIPIFNAAPLTQDIIKGPALINFFASWCIPCEAEHGTLMALSKDHNIMIYGINYKDKPEKLKAFIKKSGSPYIEIGKDISGRAGLAWGITGVPESFIIDGKGHIVYRHGGPLVMEDIETTILPLLENLKLEKPK